MCYTDVCGLYSLEIIWIITRGMLAPIRDATELALICGMIQYQNRKNLQRSLERYNGPDSLDTNQVNRIMNSNVTATPY